MKPTPFNQFWKSYFPHYFPMGPLYEFARIFWMGALKSRADSFTCMCSEEEKQVGKISGDCVKCIFNKWIRKELDESSIDEIEPKQ